MTRLIRAVIDSAALRNNLGWCASLRRDPSDAVVKANAYGHGLVPRAALRTPTRSLWRVWRGVTLRGAGVRSPIILLEVCSTRRSSLPRDENFELWCIRLTRSISWTLAWAHCFTIWLKVDSA